MINLMSAIGMTLFGIWLCGLAYVGPFKEYMEEKKRGSDIITILEQTGPSATVTISRYNGGVTNTLPVSEFYERVMPPSKRDPKL